MLLVLLNAVGPVRPLNAVGPAGFLEFVAINRTNLTNRVMKYSCICGPRGTLVQHGHRPGETL